MALGTAGSFTLYLREQQHEVGTNTFTEYTDYLISYVLTKRLNKLSTFEGTFISIETSGEKTDFTAGSAIYIMAGQTLVDKIVIEQPEYMTDGTVYVRGISSTGVEDLPRRLATELISRNYVAIPADDIVDGTGTPKGIVIEDDGSDICNTNVSGSTQAVCSLNFAGTPRMVAISNLCDATDQEWYFDYGTNGADPYADGDELFIVSRVGSGTSQYTFDLFDQTDSNAGDVKNNTENASIVNDVEIYGMDNTNTQKTTNIYHASTLRTTLDGDIDSWLTADLTHNATSITVSAIGDFANGDTIQIDNELITISSGGGTTTLTVVRGVSSTKGINHKKGSAVVRITDSGDSTITVAVTSTSGWGASGSAYIGSELVTYGGLGAGTFTSVTRTPTLAYAHGDGAPVYDVDTRDSPETLSSIGAYGIHSKSLQATSLSSKNDMDIQAERIISNYKDPVQRIVVNASDPLDFLETEDVVLGDTITINNSSLENISDGDYRTIGFDLKYDGGWPTLTVYCINDDMRVQDLSDYLLHTEKLMNKVDADRQSANYLGGQNSNPIYSSGDNLILDPPGQVILSSLTVYGSSSDESVNIVTPAWINFENSDGDTTLANFGTDSFQIDGSLGGDINLVATKNINLDATYIDATGDIRRYNGTDYTSLFNDGSDEGGVSVTGSGIDLSLISTSANINLVCASLVNIGTNEVNQGNVYIYGDDLNPALLHLGGEDDSTPDYLQMYYTSFTGIGTVEVTDGFLDLDGYTDNTNNLSKLKMINWRAQIDAAGVAQYCTVYNNTSACQLNSLTIIGFAIDNVRVTVDGTATVMSATQFSSNIDTSNDGDQSGDVTVSSQFPSFFETSGGSDAYLITLPPITAHASLKIEIEVDDLEGYVSASGWVYEG